MPGVLRHAGAAAALLFAVGSALAAPALPAAVLAALQRADVPAEALAVVLQEAGSGREVLRWQDALPMNPASLAKLLTTAAALERLGPAWTWDTPVWLAGPMQGGRLEGSLHIQGSGDPTLVLERLWLLLRRVQQLGVQEIGGDIVLDSSAFAVPDVPAGEFDGEPLRPYNVRPAALLFNFRAQTYTFVPDAAAGVARVMVEPPLTGSQIDRSVPLRPGPCDDWRAALKPAFEAGRTRFAGHWPAACGERSWAVADSRPDSYEARLVEALWREMGGRLQGRVRSGAAPATVAPTFTVHSPPLAEVVRDINKYSNNLMAQQLLLTLARAADPRSPATPEAGRELLARWLEARTGALGDEVVLDNGAGLSRSGRISARRLAMLLQQSWAGPAMSELMSSLPVSGLDGTLRRSAAAPGRAHLKTGSLRDVAGIAGYVLADDGRRYVLVAMVNHPRAAAARPALDALVQWATRDAPGATRRNAQPQDSR